jgi:uncharacterized protein YcgL (UPF0745 family)
MQLELALTNTTTAEKLVAKFKAQHDITLWRIEQENKLLKEVEAKLTKLNQKLEQQEYYLQQHNAV